MEPERPIEKLLRAFARKRREEAGAPLAMQPATRRLLQSEVARQFGRAAQPSRPRWQTLLQLWPRFAWGLGALAVLAVAAALLLPSLSRPASQKTLARNEPVAKAAPARQTSPAATPAPAPATTLPEAPAEEVRRADRPAAPAAAATPSRSRTPAEADKDLALKSEGTLAREAISAAAPPALADNGKPLEEGKAAASGPMSSNLLAPPQIYTRRYGMAGGGIAPGPAMDSLTASVRTEQRPAPEGQAQPATARTDQLGLADNSAAVAFSSSQSTTALGFRLSADMAKENKGPAQAQSYVQAPPEAKAKASRVAKAGAEKPILESFQMVQLGQELRVIDRDGSVYIGNFEAAAKSPRPSAPAVQTAAAAREQRQSQRKLPAPTLPGQPAAAQYFFRVIGTNQSLQQKVVFTGNLLPATNLTSQPSAVNQPNGSIGGVAMPPAPANLLPLPTSRISGKALIGDRQEIEIQATPAKPQTTK